MLKLLGYLLNNGVVTSNDYCASLPEDVLGLPKLTKEKCSDSECNACVDVCPTDAIAIERADGQAEVTIDLGACIACAMCTKSCPTGTIVNDSNTRTSKRRREELVISSNGQIPAKTTEESNGIFQQSIAARVVSTGCSACDLEISASGNPIFDMERYGIHIVASPRFADVLLVTGPVPKAMHEPLKRCYDAMAEPRLVIAVGTCAISGGVHKGGYTEANGVDKILPVDVYIPGCPPNPWSIIEGIRKAMKGRIYR